MNIREAYKQIVSGKLPEKADFLYITISLLIMVVFSGIFGAIIGTYEGDKQILYAGIKVPLLMVVTTFFTVPFMVIFALLITGKIKVMQIFYIVLFALTQTAFVLLALIPVMWLFVQTSDYRLNIMAMSLLFIVAGGFAIYRTGRIFQINYKLAFAKTFLITIVWAVIYTFVAGQIWWILRPWIGYTVKETELPFMRALDDKEISNVYESLQLTGATYYQRKIAK